MQEEKYLKLFNFPRSEDQLILLLLDRRGDPVTPLLNQWTYQAMVHELIGLYQNQVDLSKLPNRTPGLKEIILSSEQDKFFKENMFLDFSVLGPNFQAYLDQYITRSKTLREPKSLSDLSRNFIQEFPEVDELSGNVGKHMDLLHHLEDVIKRGCLMDVSATEQELICSDEHDKAIDVSTKRT
jgi:vacuolar protein sorting-associated protein 45